MKDGITPPYSVRLASASASSFLWARQRKHMGRYLGI